MSMDQFLLISASLALLLFVFLIVRSQRPELKTVFRLQATFWLLAFVFRPAYTLATRPPSSEPLGDPRLTFDGYSESFTSALWLSTLGLAVYAVYLFVIVRCLPHGGRAVNLASRTDPGIIITTCLVLFGLGWIGRIAAVVGAEAASSALVPFGVVSACILVIALPRHSQSSYALVAILISEATWAVLNTSKSAIISIVMALVIRWMCGSKPVRARLILAALSTILAFAIIQPLKGIDTASRQSSQAGGALGFANAQVVSILERFDGLSAVVDASLFPHQQWMSLTEAGQRVALGIIPKGPLYRFDSTLGQQWTREVKAQTFPNQFRDVSLAAGPTAEGFVLGGPLGIIVENVIVCSVTLLAALGLASRRLIPMMASGYYIFGTVLFEQGVLGLADATAKSLQIVFVAVIVSALVQSSKLKRLAPPGQTLAKSRRESD